MELHKYLYVLKNMQYYKVHVYEEVNISKHKRTLICENAYTKFI